MPHPRVINVNDDVISKWSGVPKTYSRADVASAIQNFSSSIPLDASNDNINTVLNYLNTRGHTQANLDQAVSELYHPYVPVTKKRTYWDDIKSNIGGTVDWVTSGVQGNIYGMKEAGKQALMMFDTPRRLIANTAQRVVLNNPDPAYSWRNIYDLDYAWDNPSPTVGNKFAKKHPVLSFGVDLLAPTVAAGVLAKGVGLVKNGLSYLARQGVTGLEKNAVLAGRGYPNRGYEITSRLVPETKNTSTSSFNSFSRGGGRKITGTRSGATGVPYSKGSTVNNWVVRGAYNSQQDNKIAQDVTGWNMVNPHYTWFGLPQAIPATPVVPIVNQSPTTIVTNSPFKMTDSDIIRKTGAKEGDIVVMPDGRRIKYVKGNGGLGRTNNYQIRKEYDRHQTNVKLQPNVTNRTLVRPGTTTPSVYVIGGKNPDYMNRNYNDYFPYLIK